MASPSTLGVSNAAVFGANLSIIAFAGGYLSTGNNLSNYAVGANSGLLKPDGTLTVAHGASREEIDSHHKGSASKVSAGLMPVEDLEMIFGKLLKVTTTLSDDRMYQVVGCKCENK